MGIAVRQSGTWVGDGPLGDADIPASIARDTEVTDAVETHRADTTSVHGITDTSVLETTAGAQAKADAKVAQTITNGVTTSAPSQDAVFDALALKAPLASPSLSNPTFTGTVTVPDGALAIADTSGLQTALDGKVNDTGDETIAGVKTFSSDPIIPDEAYDATAWNGSLEPPTKNAVRDKIESMGGGAIRVEDEGSSIVAAATGINFAGAGVVVTDAGSNEALVTIAATGWRVVDSELLVATTASVSLDAPSTPVALRLVCTGLRSTDTGDTDRVMLLRFNADTGANYGWVRVGEATSGSDTVGGASNAADDTGATSIQIGPIPTSLTNTTRAGIAVINIDHHAASAWKSLTAQSYAKKSNAANQLMYAGFGTWESTSRITSVQLLPSTGSWAAGGCFVLEGLYL